MIQKSQSRISIGRDEINKPSLGRGGVRRAAVVFGADWPGVKSQTAPFTGSKKKQNLDDKSLVSRNPVVQHIQRVFVCSSFHLRSTWRNDQSGGVSGGR